MDFKKQLWLVFKEKIQADWNKEYYLIAPSLNELKGAKTNIARAISSDIKRVTQSNISMDTIHRYLTNDGFADEVKTTTLDIFAQYVGYQDWDDFQEHFTPAAPARTQLTDLSSVPPYPVSPLVPKESKSIRFSSMVTLAGLLVVALLLSAMNDPGFLVRQAQIIAFIGVLLAGTTLLIKEINY